MAVLGIDPGATRCGWACVGKRRETPVIVGSGIYGVVRTDEETFQEYKLRLIEYWTRIGPSLFAECRPERIVCEIIPAVGGGNFVVATQSHLAAVVSTVILTLGLQNGIPIAQVSANTVKRRIGGKKDATKSMVRRGVYEFMPEMKAKKDKEWKKISDESDACAIALCDLGFSR